MNEEKEIEIIYEEMNTEHSIRCYKCKEIERKYNCDEYYASEQFYKNGWRIKNNHVYCPKCS